MPTRRTFELIVITVFLMYPAVSMIKIWAIKHRATTATMATADAAAVAIALT